MSPIYIIAFAILIAVIISIVSVGKTKTSLIRRIAGTFGKKPSYQDYDIKSRKSYWEYAKNASSKEGTIDEITWDDLDMDMVYKRVNACNTSVGEEYLYGMLHEINHDDSALNKREELINYFEKNTAVREEVQLTLLKLGKKDYNRLASFIFDAESKLLDNDWIYIIMAVMPFLWAAFIIVNPAFGAVSAIISLLINATVYFRLKLKLDTEISAISYFSSMLYACNKILKTADGELLPLLADVKSDYETFKPIKGKTSNTTQRDTANVAFISEYFKMLFLIDIVKYNRVIKLLVKESEAMNRLFCSFGELDAAISILSFRQSLKEYCKPSFSYKNSIEFEGIYHPLMDEAVTNSGVIDRSSIITGPNASGKSTFIKALAVNGILAQTINTCAAKRYSIRHSLVMTSMAVRDSLIRGDSYFITEIKSLKRVIDMMEKTAVTCFIDEILRGTNTIERIAASASMLRFIEDKDCLCMVASHDIELTTLMKETYDNYHFSEDVGNEGVSFDFILKDGAAHTKNAIRLLDYLGYDKDIVAQANTMVAEYLKKGAW